MKLWDINNNPLFLANWRERLRPAQLISGTIVALSIIFLILVNDSTSQQTYNYYVAAQAGHHESRQGIYHWPDKFFFYLAVLQGVILFLFGTVSAYRMAARERTSGTIEFHRSSPTSRIIQIIGIMLGAPSL